MIINGTITPDISDTPLSWQPTSTFQSTLLTASLLTLLSYQATSIIYDLLLGLKPRHTSTAPSLHALLLADEASPLSFLAALLRNDTLDQLRFHLPQHTPITRTPRRIPSSITTRLLLLLISAPIANILAVIFALEFDTSTTFASAGVSLAIGVSPNNVTQYEYIQGCLRLADAFPADSSAQFFICTQSATFRPLPSRSTASSVRAIAGVQGDVRVEIFIKGAESSAVLNTHADVAVEGTVYRLSHAFRDDTIRELAVAMGEGIDKNCEDLAPGPVAPAVRQTTDQVREVVADAPLRCESLRSGPLGFTPTFDAIVASARVMRQNITVVEVDSFLLADAAGVSRDVDVPPVWIRGEGLTVMTTRAPIAPVLWIAIAVGAVLLVRLLVELLTNNDVADGVEAIVASALGFQDGYEVIRCNYVVRYDHKLQRGELSHYGVAKVGWGAVDSFDRAVGVLEGGKYDGMADDMVDDGGELSSA